jgi:hypothetical protein
MIKASKKPLTWPKMGAGGAQEGLRSLGMYLQQQVCAHSMAWGSCTPQLTVAQGCTSRWHVAA